MKKILALFLAIAMIACLFTFNVSALTYKGVVDSGLDYTEEPGHISNPMVGYPSTPSIYLKLSGNTARNDSGFVHYFIDMRMFSGGYTIDSNGVRQPLTPEQTADRVKCSFNSMWPWNGNQRNQGGPEDIPLNEDALNALRGTFENLRKNGGTCLIRPEYAIDADVHNEPYDFEIILAHARQLSEIITEYSDVVGGIEVGTAGPFGEMHTSPYCAAKYMNQIIDTYIENTPSSVKLMVRNLTYVVNYICDSFSNNVGKVTLKNGTVQSVQYAGKFNWINLLPFDNFKYKDQETIKRIGMFNDGYMYDSNDCGTWSNISRSTGVQYLEWASATGYYGGEYGSNSDSGLDKVSQKIQSGGTALTRHDKAWLPEKAIPEMYKTHVNYIHGNVYSSTMGSVKTCYMTFSSYTEALSFVIDLYEQSQKLSEEDSSAKAFDYQKVWYSNTEELINKQCTVVFDAIGYDNFMFTEKLSKMSSTCDNSAYYGRSCYSFIRDHLGYRFILRSSKLSNSVDRGGILKLSGEIENTGFGNCVQDKLTQIVITDKSGKEVACQTVKYADSLTWLSQTSSDYNLELRLPTSLEAGEYDVYMRVCNVTSDGEPNTKTCVRFANNKDYYNTSIKANLLGSFTVNNTMAQYSSENMQQVTTVFDDVADGYWGNPYITGMCTLGLMSGMSQTTFSPEDLTSRAMLVRVLYNYIGRPDVSDCENPFKDVSEGQWYTDAIKWAYSNGVVFGMTQNTFEPNTTITREQFASIMFRFAKEIDNQDMSGRGDVSKFTDFSSTSGYAVDAMKWCVANKYISGMTPTEISPISGASRAQMASIIMRYIDKQSK